MTSPYRHGQSANLDPDSSSRSTSSTGHRGHSTSGVTQRSGSPFHTHPSRAALLNATAESATQSSRRADRSECSGMWYSADAETTFPDGSFATSQGRRRFSAWSGDSDMMDGSEDPAAARADGAFFVPSYLENSPYVRELEAAQLEARNVQRDSNSAGGIGGEGVSGEGDLTAASLPPGSHRGMSHTIIERLRSPPDDGVDALSPLPTRWNQDDSWGGIEIGRDGSTVKYTNPRNQNDRDHEACAVRADHFMPAQCGLYYFEVHILSGKRDDTLISIGFSTPKASLARPIGWELESWGYHGDDGRCFSGQNVGKAFGPSYSQGDVIGCGVNFRDSTAFFTKNGAKIGSAFTDHFVSRGKLYPSVSLKRPGEHICANFGQTPFVYDIDAMMKNERQEIWREIAEADTSRIVEPVLDEKDLIEALVLQFLQHDGYVETARAFAEELDVQKEALNMGTNGGVEGMNVQDDEDAHNRQRIRRAILEGDIDRALKYTNAYYPGVLAANEQVYFRLRCRRFIELVRKAALLNMTSGSKRSNGLAANDGSQDMDIDGNERHPLDDVVVNDHFGTDSVDLVELEREMLEYGQALQAEYASDLRPEFSLALNNIWALVAYKNPLKEPQVSHLLDKEGRMAVSEELNSAILQSQGKSSRAALEKLYAQIKVITKDLRLEGGDGAFVSVENLLDDTSQLGQAQ